MQHKASRVAAIVLVALAVVLAITALFVGRDRNASPAASGTSEARSSDRDTPAAEVVVTARALEAGAVLQAADLKLETREGLVAGSYGDASRLIGQVPVRPLAAGAVIHADDLSQGLSLLLGPGERAIAVPVDELSGAGNRIQPGEMVDVFLSLEEGRGDDASAQARLLLPRLRVLGYGAEDLPSVADEGAQAESPDASTTDRADDSAAPADGGRAASIAQRNSSSTRPSPGATSTRPSQVRSAVLAVPVADANRLLLGAQRGRLFLALRHPADPGEPDRDLFPDAPPVLTARPGLDSAARADLDAADNAAFAGLDLEGLSGKTRRPTARPSQAPTSPARAPRPRVEIIRGSQP